MKTQTANDTESFSKLDKPTEKQTDTRDHRRTQEKVTLQLQLVKQEETLKANDQLIQNYEQQTHYLQEQIQTEQQHKSNLFEELLKSKTQATTFKVSSIALAVMFVIFLVLAFTKVLVF